MVTAKNNTSCFKNDKSFISDQCVLDHQSLVKPIAWFAKMARDKTLSADKTHEVLNQLEDFLDKKEFEKAEIIAELQLAYAFQEAFKEKQAELTVSAEFKK